MRPASSLRRPLVLTVFAACLLGGCTTLDDFRRFTPEHRAQLVCERQPDIGSMDMRLGELQRQHDSTRASLDRGYHIHRQCHKMATTVTEVCETQGNKRVCKTQEGREKRLECEDTPVPLDAALETGKLAAYAQDIAQLGQERQWAWQRCVERVRPLSPEAAFSLY